MQKTRFLKPYLCKKCFWQKACKEPTRDCPSTLDPKKGKSIFGTSSAKAARRMTKAGAI